ncbi:hypothetical protein PFISCL1PPCAC_4717, partial [Pristionchus fissidentatus]
MAAAFFFCLIALLIPCVAALGCFSGEISSALEEHYDTVVLSTANATYLCGFCAVTTDDDSMPIFAYFSDLSFPSTIFAANVTLPMNGRRIHPKYPTLLDAPRHMLCAVCGGDHCNSRNWTRLLIDHTELIIPEENPVLIESAATTQNSEIKSTTTVFNTTTNATNNATTPRTTVSVPEGEPIGNKFVFAIIITMAI